MPLHHYLPATFLAFFSLDKSIDRRRERIIFVGDKKSKNIFPQTTGNVGAENNLYTLLDVKKETQSIDEIWSEYESKLHIAIPRLIVGDLDAKTWIRLLVPFVSCMLARGPDFDTRFKSRIISLMGEKYSQNYLTRSHINRARIFEIQRLLFSITSSKWIIISYPKKGMLLTNDLGYCPFLHPRAMHFGMAIPIGLHHVLAISPRKSGCILKYFGEMWRPNIQFTKSNCEDLENLNRSIVSRAQRFVFSPSYDLVEKFLKDYEYTPRPIEPEQMGFFDSKDSRAFEFTWHRLAIFLEKGLTKLDKSEDFPLDWQYFFEGWTPPVIIPTNLIGFPPPLQNNRSSISIKYYDPIEYYVLNDVQNLANGKCFEDMINLANEGFQKTKDDNLKVEFLFSISIGLSNLGDINNSLKILDFLIEKYPLRYDFRLNRSADYLSIGSLQKAFEDLDFILSNNPNYTEALINLANYYFKIKDFEASLNIASKACDLSPKGSIFGVALYLRGLANFSIDQKVNAFEDLSLSLEYLSDNEKTASGLLYKSMIGIELIDTKMNSINTQKKQLYKNWKASKTKQKIVDYSYNNALHDLSRCIKLGKEFPNILISAYNIRGSLFRKMGKIDLALEDYRNASLEDPINLKFLFIQGEILIELGKFEESIIIYNKVLELSPTTFKALTNRGIAKFMSEATEEGKKDFLDAYENLGLSVDSGSPLRHLVHIFLLEGDINTAKQYLQKCQNIEPNSPQNKILESLLKVYKNEPKKAVNLINELINKFGKIPDIMIYKIIPLTSLQLIGEAKSIYLDNINQVTSYTEKIVLKHIKNLISNNLIGEVDFIINHNYK